MVVVVVVIVKLLKREDDQRKKRREEVGVTRRHAMTRSARQFPANQSIFPLRVMIYPYSITEYYIGACTIILGSIVLYYIHSYLDL